MPPVGQDPRWEVFAPFHDYLSTAFPLVHSTLSLTKVNTYGLLFEWTGSDTSLKPILLAAHQGTRSGYLFSVSYRFKMSYRLSPRLTEVRSLSMPLRPF